MKFAVNFVHYRRSNSQAVDDEENSWWSGTILKEHVDYYIEFEKINPKEAIKMVLKIAVFKSEKFTKPIILRN